MTPFLFVTDLDNTLVGDDGALKLLNERLSDHRQQYGTKIVYATGRSLFLYRQLASEKPLLPPDALITSVGTEIYLNHNKNNWCKQWAAVLSQGWNREAVVAIASKYGDLVPQSTTEQGKFKVSYYLTPAAVEVVTKLKYEIAQNNLNIKVIYSGSTDLDLLPKQGDKGLAVKFLQQNWGIEDHFTVCCGDSGNDIALFSVESRRGIIVGNAKQELRQWYEDNLTDYLYLAKGDYAAGILEGLQHFNFLE